MVAVGAEVHRFKVGDEVIARAPDGDIGTLAEYIVIEGSACVEKPKSISHQVGSVSVQGEHALITMACVCRRHVLYR